MLNKFGHLKIKEASTPFYPSIKLIKNDGRVVAQIEYATAIGSLIYAMQCTRLDIAFAVSKLSRFINNPSLEHLNSWLFLRRLRILSYNVQNFLLF